MRTNIQTVGHPVGKLHRFHRRAERLWPNVVDAHTTNTPVTVTASATPHALGSWSELIASTSGPVDWLQIHAAATFTSATDTSSLVDIGIGPAGSETVIASSLPSGFRDMLSAGGLIPTPAMFPVTIPKGTRISCRAQALIASDTVTVYTETYFQGLRCGSVVDTYGANTASSRGTNMPTSDTYVELTAATTQPYQALVVLPAVGGTNNSAGVSITYTLGAGPAAAETTLLTVGVRGGIAEAITMESRPVAIYSGHVPAGTRLAGKQSVGVNYRDMIVLGIRY